MTRINEVLTAIQSAIIPVFVSEGFETADRIEIEARRFPDDDELP